MTHIILSCINISFWTKTFSGLYDSLLFCKFEVRKISPRHTAAFQILMRYKRIALTENVFFTQRKTISLKPHFKTTLQKKFTYTKITKRMVYIEEPSIADRSTLEVKFIARTLQSELNCT